MKKFVVYPWLLVVGGLVGLIASGVITFEKLRLAENPAYIPSCSINPIISCGSVMKTAQASVFGFPNSWIGLVGFGMVIAVGMGMFAGARYKAWYWQLFNLGTLGGVAMVTWLFVQSVFVIHALCPWCMVVWSVTIPIFWYTTLHNLAEGNLPTPKPLKSTVAFLQSYKNVILVLWYLVILIAIGVHFWYFWKTVI